MEGSEAGQRENRFERRPVLAWLLILLLVALAAEVLLRLVEPEAVHFGKEFREVYRYHPRWYTDFEPDTSANIRLSDGERGYFLNFLVTVNEFGFRWHDREADDPVPAADAASFVHAIGDSFTMGWGVNYESSYPALLSESLGPDVSVLNLGLNGYGTIGATEKSIALLDRFPPRAVVYLFTENDYDDDSAAARHAARPAIVHAGFALLNGLRRNSYLVSLPFGLRWWLQFRPSRLAADPAPGGSEAQRIQVLEVAGKAQPELGAASKLAMDRYAMLLDELQVPLIVIVHGDGSAAADFAAHCRDKGIDVHRVAFGQSLLLRREGHLSRTGNRLLAEFVRTRLAPTVRGGG